MRRLAWREADKADASKAGQGPLLTVAIAPQLPGERDRFIAALTRLTEEDPLLKLSLKPETGEITIHLYGALQREVIEAWLLERYGL